MRALVCNMENELAGDMAEGFRIAGLQMDEAEISELNACLENSEYLFVFSVGFEPRISLVCQEKVVPYFSWIVKSDNGDAFDCPEIKNSCNYIFCFDQGLQEEIVHVTGGRVYHLPLAVDTERWENQCLHLPEEPPMDISYVWEEEKRLYEDIDLSGVSGLKEYTKGYVEALLAAQEKLYGSLILKNGMTDSVRVDMNKNFSLPDQIRCSPTQILENISTHRQRIHLLRRAASIKLLNLYGTWHIPGIDSIKNSKFQVCGGDETEKAKIFSDSKINLCLIHREVRTGITSQIFQVLACGGFVLVNFQPELPELFNIGEHLEAFTSSREMEEKIRYYLAHEGERRKIAENGKRLVGEIHSYKARAIAMFNTVFAGIAD